MAVFAPQFLLRKSGSVFPKPSPLRSYSPSLPLPNPDPHLISIAPMMDYTNKHQRTLMRLLTKRAVLYTEMVVCNTLLHRSDPIRSLTADFSVEEPLVLQLGGACPAAMHSATKIAADFGYKDVNINVGCPSDKVSGSGSFGAVLMRSPRLVCDLALAAGEALGAAPTVKCRIGVDELDSYEHLSAFIEQVSSTGGVGHFIVHARRAVLGGKFTPKQNRTVPPLKYCFVHRLVRDFPHLRFSLNGGVLTPEEARQQLLVEEGGLAGVMVGRAAVSDPFLWRHVDSELYGADANPGLSRRQVLARYAAYAGDVERQVGSRSRYTLLKPVHGLLAGCNHGKKFRCSLAEYVKDGGMSIHDVIMRAADSVPDAEVMDSF